MWSEFREEPKAVTLYECVISYSSIPSVIFREFFRPMKGCVTNIVFTSKPRSLLDILGHSLGSRKGAPRMSDKKCNNISLI